MSLNSQVDITHTTVSVEDLVEQITDVKAALKEERAELMARVHTIDEELGFIASVLAANDRARLADLVCVFEDRPQRVHS